jgi:hypothetical protein
LNVVRLLLREETDVTAQGGEYGNALHAAVSQLKRDVIEVLLKAGGGNMKRREWDLMYKEAKRRMRAHGYSKGALKRTKATLEMLNNWLAKHRVSEAEEVISKITEFQVEEG